jgi:GTP-binding protein
MEIRNIAIIAHVDHGKTTLTDALLRQTGMVEEGVTMDTNALELERGITIYSKNASLNYKDTKINIVDTPGHADFGSEVERVLRAIDSVLLVVDAQEGPMPQTRFVLRKSLELGLKPIVVINKIDKPAADPARCEEEVLELFLELHATDEQCNFPVVYANGRAGIAKKKLTDESNDLTPLLDTILEHVPAASAKHENDTSFIFQPFNLGYDNFLGRLAIGRVYNGNISPGANVFIKSAGVLTNGEAGKVRTGKIIKIFNFIGTRRTEVNEATAGDIVMIAGIPDIDIGETVTTDSEAKPLDAIAIDEPTIVLNFLVNSSPFAGREGKFVTSRQIRERLERELQVNVGLRVEFSEIGSGDTFRVYGRGELHIGILLENMRREGYELQVSQPQAVVREIDGVKCEPFEEVIADVPNEFQGVIIERLGLRGFVMHDMKVHETTVRLTFEGPTRGLLGYRNQFIIDTKGNGILSSRFLEFRPYAGEIRRRAVGSMTSMMSGKALAFALWNLQERGVMYIKPTTEVYEGMVIGNTSKGEELAVNPTKGKQLTNMRASGSDEAIDLVPPYEITIERGLEIVNEDEYLEITPTSVRLRKQILDETTRLNARARKKE